MSTPVAVIGFGCRFPGGVTNGEKLWELLIDKKSARSEIPPERYNVDAFYHPDGDRYGTTNNRAGHFLAEDVSLFDAPFFSISPAEAMAMDPMQRMLLEVAYEALEAAGKPLHHVAGSRTSCFVGCSTKDYEEMQRRDMELAPKYQSTGASQTMLSNRLSYFFNLKGPSVTLDTACSSGLVAVHLACQSLLSGESSMAIAGGSNLILSPDIQIEMSDMVSQQPRSIAGTDCPTVSTHPCLCTEPSIKPSIDAKPDQIWSSRISCSLSYRILNPRNRHFLSPDSISYSFDDRANGYARGEGIGAVILKPLHLALRDNDPIRAVIRATAAGSDGKTPGITMPSRAAQVDLIRAAYQAAGCDLSGTGYFEAHGTGTAAGDPIETGAIGEVFAAHRPPGPEDGQPIPLFIGSLKTNMGHLEIVLENVANHAARVHRGASGIAGLLKAILSVEKGVIAPNIWFERGNPNIDFEGWRIKVPTEAHPWPLEGPRRASVNSFGYGGTNAHVIVEDAQQYLLQHRREERHGRKDSGVATPTDDTPYVPSSKSTLFMLSANDERGLKSFGEALADHLTTITDVDETQFLADLAYTLGERRSRLPRSCPVVASTMSELGAALRKVVSVQTQSSHQPQTSFIFTGQGAQWWGMGRELLHHPVFRDSLSACDAIVESLGSDWSLMEELLKSQADSRVNEATISQPLCTALQVALVDLLQHWNIRPHSVVGHSSGEIAAAYAIGALSTRSAITIAYYRGLLAPKVRESGMQGRMMAVALSENDAKREISSLDASFGTCVVACVNSPRGVTVSGDITAIERLHKDLDDKSVFARVLQVDTAYHSHHMQTIAEEYLARLLDAGVSVLNPEVEIPMYSSVTEDIVSSKDLGPAYWVSNLVGCVRFSGALQKLCLTSQNGSRGVDVLLEIGPHSLFKGPVKELLQEIFGGKSQILYQSMLIRGKCAEVTALEAAGALLANSYPVDIHNVNFPSEPKGALSVLVDLPQYSWNHTRGYWCESRLSKDYRLRQFARSEILGASVPDWNPMEPRFRNYLRLREQPWLRDHIVQGDVLFPACGYLCMAIEACRQMCVIAPSLVLPKGIQSSLEYRLREVHISRALVVPETDEGVETCLSLKICSGSSSTSFDTWHDFCVYSYNAAGGWVENCRGSVSVSNNSIVDRELESECQQDWKKISQQSSSKINIESFYKTVDAIGLTYGPTFQCLQEVHVHPQGLDQVAGVIKVSNTRSTHPKEFEHDRLLHPSTLDNFLQLALAALGGADMQKLKYAMVPTFVEEISVSANIATQIDDQLNVVVSAQRRGSREAEANIFALDPVTGKPVVLMDNFRFVAINAANIDSDVTFASTKHCYKAVWEPDVQLIDRPSLNKVLQAAPRPDDRPKMVRELELLAYFFIDKALSEVKKEETAMMLPHHQKFFANLEELKENVVTKVHPQQTTEWQNLQEPEVFAKLENMVQHYRHHETAYDGKLLVKVGEALPAVFRKEVEPLALMTEGNLLEDYYTTAVGMPNTYAQISRYTSMLSHKYPNLSFLEIGAGTGGATVPVLKGLSGCESLHQYPRLKSYTYTDISSYFFQRAAEKFADFAQFMDFKKLNIEDDPETQNFKAASYDVIVAANVLHATSDMHCTMKHARKLLKPGGKLILLEMTNRLLAASVIFGTLPGWWNASEAWRTGGPLLTESQWQDVLHATGFGDLEASSPDVLEPLEEGTRLMIATAAEPKLNLPHGLPTPPEHAPVFIVTAGSSLKMRQMEEATALKKRLEVVSAQAQIVPLSHLSKYDIAGAVCVSFAELSDYILADPSPVDLDTLKHISEVSAGLIWVTRGAASIDHENPELAVFQGLARTIRAEYESFRCVTVDLDAKTKLPSVRVANLLVQVYEQILSSTLGAEALDSEFVEIDGVLHIKRAIEDDSVNKFVLSRTDASLLSPELEDVVRDGRPLQLQLSPPGTNSEPLFEEAPSRAEPLKPTEVEIQVFASSLNLVDVHTVNGEHVDSQHGQEYAGIISKIGSHVRNFKPGDRVAAWTQGTLATHIRAQAAFVQEIPDTTTFEVAATLPLAYTTAYYALIHIAHLDANESVLIHKAADPIGQAALQIALNQGARTYLTVRHDEEKQQLVNTYGVNSAHIFSTQDIKFVAALRRFTHGRGVDVVLNTLTGEALQATFSCVAPFGRFVELGNGSAKVNERLEMAPFKKGVSFISVEMGLLLTKKSALASRMFQKALELVAEERLSGVADLQVKKWSELAKAKNEVEDGKVKKVVMTPVAGDQVLVAQKPPAPIIFSPEASYLLAGGLGGLGRSISSWLVAHGARHLIYTSRSGASSPEAASLIASLTASGICTAVLTLDISDATALQTALSKTLKTFPPIRGVIQGAMSLNDSLFANMTPSTWSATLRPKVHGSKALHDATLTQPLDFFVLLSSLHNFIGNPGQSNYAAAGAYQVALARHRVARGLPACAIDVGIVGDVGYVVEKTEGGKRVVVQDFRHINEHELLGILEAAIREPMMGHLVTGLDLSPGATVWEDGTSGESAPFWARDPVLSHLEHLRPHLRASESTRTESNDSPSASSLPLRAQLAASTDSSTRTSLVLAAFLKKLSRSLMLPVSEIDPAQSMASYGTDSLVAVEIKNWVGREVGVGVSVFDVLQSGSIGELVERVGDRFAEGISKT